MLAQAAYPNSKIFFYDSLPDSAHSVLSRVNEWAEQSNSQIHTLSILSHGAEGGFELGNEWITDASLTKTASDWLQLSQFMFDDARVDIFGCNVDANGSGQSLLDDLSELTGTDVFASSNITGKGGDWILESSSLQHDCIIATGMFVPFDIELLEASDASLAWYNANWSYRKQITIDYTKVSATQTNFAVLVNLASDSDLQSKALANANDLIFTAADGVTKLDYEIASYSSVNGQLVAWVRIPSLSASVNTVVFVLWQCGCDQSAKCYWSVRFEHRRCVSLE